MLYRGILALALVATTQALQVGPGAAVGRRAALAKAAGAVAPLVLAPLVSQAAGNVYIDGKLIDSSDPNSRLATGVPRTFVDAGDYARSADKRAAQLRIGGTYSDPAHSGAQRKIVQQGGAVIITGADEDGVAWKVKGKVTGSTLLIDFTPKGGPADVEAKFATGVGITFPDGNVWKKV